MTLPLTMVFGDLSQRIKASGPVEACVSRLITSPLLGLYLLSVLHYITLCRHKLHWVSLYQLEAFVFKPYRDLLIE